MCYRSNQRWRFSAVLKPIVTHGFPLAPMLIIVFWLFPVVHCRCSKCFSIPTARKRVRRRADAQTLLSLPEEVLLCVLQCLSADDLLAVRAVSTHRDTHVCIHTHPDTQGHTRMDTNTQGHTHKDTHTQGHTCSWTHTHTHTQLDTL